MTEAGGRLVGTVQLRITLLRSECSWVCGSGLLALGRLRPSVVNTVSQEGEEGRERGRREGGREGGRDMRERGERVGGREEGRGKEEGGRERDGRESERGQGEGVGHSVHVPTLQQVV